MISIEVSGLEMIQENLDMMCVAVRDRILKKALSEAGKHIVDAAKANCPSDTGTLRESISMKVGSGKDKGVAAYCIIGPKSGIKVPVRVVRKGKNKGAVMIAVPTYYAHFIEFGHRIFLHGHDIGFVGPKPFMRPAWDEFGGEAALYTIVDTLQQEVEIELSKTFRYKMGSA